MLVLTGYRHYMMLVPSASASQGRVELKISDSEKEALMIVRPCICWNWWQRVRSQEMVHGFDADAVCTASVHHRFRMPCGSKISVSV